MGMKKIASTCLRGVLTGLLIFIGLQSAAAETAYPNRPIRLVVPYPAGGSVDFVGRITGNYLGERLKQSLIIDNRGGANGFIGSNGVAKSTPDGYTLLLGSIGPLAINPGLYSNVPFNALTDFAPISMVAQVPLVLIVKPTLDVSSVSDLLAKARANPGMLTFGSAGNGSTQHLGMELFKSMTGVDIRHIPYKGEAASVVDLLAGRIDMMMALLPPIYSQIKAGNLKPIAVATLQRLPTMPNVPTVDEQGIKGFEVVSWMSVMAPAGTPKEIVDRLSAELSSMADDPGIKEKFDLAGGVIPMKSSAAELERTLKADTEKWGKIIKDANVKMN